MQMIRQHDDGVDAVRLAQLYIVHHFTKGIDVFSEQASATSSKATVKKNVPPGWKARTYLGMV